MENKEIWGPYNYGPVKITGKNKIILKFLFLKGKIVDF